MSTDYRFVSEKQESESGWSHVFENRDLHIVDSNNNIVCTISGKEQLLDMCESLGIVGTGVVLTSRF